MVKTHANEKEFYTVSDAAELLSVSASTVWRWIQSGQLRAYRVGQRTIRIRREDLAFLITPIEPSPSDPLNTEDEEDIWAGYDPDAVIEAIDKAAGTWADVDSNRLIDDLYRAREEGSRSWDRPAWPIS